MIGDFANRNWVFNVNMDLDDATFGREVKITTEAMRWIEKGCTELQALGTPETKAVDPGEEAR